LVLTREFGYGIIVMLKSMPKTEYDIKLLSPKGVFFITELA
jgi:hypothetical protein